MLSTMLNKEEIITFVNDWMISWNNHDLEGVLRVVTDDVEFEHWTGRTTRGLHLLRRAWQTWFADHGNFQFSVKNLYVDTARQTVIFEWSLEWPSPESSFREKREIRQGIDVIVLRNGKVANKRSYIKTVVKVDGQPVPLSFGK